MDHHRRHALVAAAGTLGLLPLTGLRAAASALPETPGDPEGGDGPAQPALTWTQGGAGAVARTLQDKLRERVSIADFGAASSASAATNTAAIHAAMKYLMDQSPGAADFYPVEPADPSRAERVPYGRRDRRTGAIHVPAGAYRVEPNVFSSLDHPRAPYVGFDFIGDHPAASVLILETRGVDAWFYDNGRTGERYQLMTFRDLGFSSDDYRHGNFARVYSSGGPKQFLIDRCEFRNIQRYMLTEGTGNADLMRTISSLIEHYGEMLTLDNEQSVQHDFIGTHFRSWGSMVRVKRHGGGNVNIRNGFIDFLWNAAVSPAAGNFMFVQDADANIGQGNCTYKWEDCRVEVEAYTTTPGPPPFGLVKTVGHPNAAIPRVVFDNVNFVNGKTYTMTGAGKITAEGYRRITAVALHPRKFVEFRNCVMLKTFFYDVTGNRDDGSPNAGGYLKFTNCFDGIEDELPPTDAALGNLHSRVTYRGSAGRVVTEGMIENTTGSSFTRKLLDADPNWRRSFAREPSSTTKICSFKHYDNGWPFAANGGNDHYVDIPPGLAPLRIYVRKPADGASNNAYRLHLGNGDKSVIFGSSRTGRFRDEHVIDLDHLELSGHSRLRLWATGAGTDFQGGGTAYIEYV